MRLLVCNAANIIVHYQQVQYRSPSLADLMDSWPVSLKDPALCKRPRQHKIQAAVTVI